MKKYQYLFLLILIILFMSIFLSYRVSGSSKISSNSSNHIPNSDLNFEITAAEGPIEIEGDNWFALYASSGTGTVNDPFIIEYRTFTIGNETTSKIIKIDDTEAHFIIRNCLIFDGEIGLRLSDVSNGKIINNTFYLLEDQAINLKDCKNIDILDNKILYSDDADGISVWDSEDIEIENNLIYKARDAIILAACNNFEIKSNEIFENDGFGLQISGGEIGSESEYTYDGIIKNNEIYENDNFGIKISKSYELELKKNKIRRNGKSGLILESCHNNLIKDNKIYDNRGSGIILRELSWFNQIDDNKIYDNRKYGINLDDWSWYNEITDNYIKYNKDEDISVSFTSSFNTLERNECKSIYNENFTFFTIIFVYNPSLVAFIFIRNFIRKRKIVEEEKPK